MDARRIPFTPEDESRIASAATWGMIIAVCSLVGSAISLLTTTLALNSLSAGMPGMGMFAIIPWVSIGVTVLLNIWLFQASSAFRKVAVTDEGDQQYLLEGFRKLRAYFMVQVILILAALAMGLLAGIFVASWS